MNSPQSIEGLVAQLAALLREQGRTLATVESCTGGMVGAAIVAPSGASNIYPGGFITYSDEMKQSAVGVKLDTLKAHGAVSSQVAIEMALGGCDRARATHGVAITGIAGPKNVSDTKRVGTVWICVATNAGSYDCRRFQFPEDEERSAIRTRATLSALRMCIGQLTDDYQKLDHECERFTA